MKPSTKRRNAEGDGLEAYRGEYSEPRFWQKVNGLPGEAVRALLEKVLTLYVLVSDRRTPPWARLLIVGVLGYFICPLDLVPDIAPVLGYMDDAALAALLLAELDTFVTSAHRGRVKRLMPAGCGDNKQPQKEKGR